MCLFFYIYIHTLYMYIYIYKNVYIYIYKGIIYLYKIDKFGVSLAQKRGKGSNP